MKNILKWIGLLLIVSSLSGCFYWMRAYQVYLQMDEFDENFSITSAKEFSLHFKQPKLYSSDFISLSKVQPSSAKNVDSKKQWHYLFRKMDKKQNIVNPEISFYFNLSFNEEDKLTQWTFSPLFLQIAPAEFLEVSLRSLAGAEINKETRQLKANTDLVDKISSKLPQKKKVISQLGEPIEIKVLKDKEIYQYHFVLDTEKVEEGYEDRVFSKIELTFDNKTNELIKMSGRFVGLKISVKYRNYQDEKKDTLALDASEMMK
jgi:hypothetical protein